MAADKISLVFFGSGPVSKVTLEFLINNFHLEAIITKPSTIQEMKSSAPGVPIFPVKNRMELTGLIKREKFKSRLGLVVDFGIIIEKPAIESFDLGIVNSHFSLLPRWRGADPISFAILKGDEKTGVSLMLINEQLDKGDLVAQESLDIPKNCTTPKLTERLIELSNKMLRDYLPEYTRGKIKPYPQPNSTDVTYSRKLQKTDGLIDWNKPAKEIERQIRAFAGWPKSFAKIGRYSLIIVEADVVDKNGRAGEFEVSGGRLLVFCGQEALEIKKVQPPGKKIMPVSAFLAGYKLSK